MDNKYKKQLNEYCVCINKSLSDYINAYRGGKLTESLTDAMNYSLSAGGKRLRPVLTLEFCRILSNDPTPAIAPACAIEMIHTFSLIHDDLPAMDDDDMRRGKPSCHKAFGEAQAILAGDALATLPYLVICRDPYLSASAKSEIVSVLANETQNMIGGQIIDIENESRKPDSENLLDMYSRKTCALLRAACKIGCIAAGADSKAILHAERFAEKLGLAFQIIDDILDVEGNEEELGKPIGSDIEQNKTTYVTLFGIDKAHQRASELTNEAKEALEYFDKNEFLLSLTDSLLIRRN